jgi:hypothetical protein
VSAGRARGACTRYPASKIRYRSKVQARSGLDRARQIMAAEGIPAELQPVHIERCPACRGWHTHQDRDAVARFREEVTTLPAGLAEQLDAA